MNLKRVFAWLVVVVTFGVLMFEIFQLKPIWEIILGASIGFIGAVIWIWDDLEKAHGQDD